LDTVTGSFVFDDSLFSDGVSQPIKNSNITQLSFTTTSSAGTTSFGLADVVTGDEAFYDSFHLPPSIVDGNGLLARTAGLALSINGPDGIGLFSDVDGRLVELYLGSWTEAAVATPLPAALPLFATGLGVLGWAARRRKQKQLAA
jgi:hypothetical protein